MRRRGSRCSKGARPRSEDPPARPWRGVECRSHSANFGGRIGRDRRGRRSLLISGGSCRHVARRSPSGSNSSVALRDHANADAIPTASATGRARPAACARHRRRSMREAATDTRRKPRGSSMRSADSRSFARRMLRRCAVARTRAARCAAPATCASKSAAEDASNSSSSARSRLRSTSRQFIIAIVATADRRRLVLVAPEQPNDGAARWTLHPSGLSCNVLLRLAGGYESRNHSPLGALRSVSPHPRFGLAGYRRVEPKSRVSTFQRPGRVESPRQTRYAVRGARAGLWIARKYPSRGGNARNDRGRADPSGGCRDL